MINLFSLAIFFYVTVRFIFPLPLHMLTKIGLSALVLAIAMKHFFIQHFFGGLASPTLPRFVLILSGGLFATLLFLLCFLVVRDLLLIIAWGLAKAGYSLPYALTGLPASLFLLGLAVLLSAYGVYEAVRLPDIRMHEVTFKRLPQELDGLTVVQLTDLHASAFNPEHKVRDIVEAVNRLSPDLILITGDFVDGSTEARANDIAPLADLKARYGVYGSAGNHEYYSGYSNWMRKFAELRILMLNNQHRTVRINGKELVLAGITDPVAAQFGEAVPNISVALEGAPSDAFCILLAHRPDNADLHVARGVDLQLSGHTHGGQIIGLNAVVRNFNKGYLKGWYEFGSSRMYLSPGTSLWNGFPVRIGVPSEITLITLRSPSSL